MCMLVVWNREYFLRETKLWRDEKSLGKPPNLSWATVLWNLVTLYNSGSGTSCWWAHQPGQPFWRAAGTIYADDSAAPLLELTCRRWSDKYRKNALSPSIRTTVSSMNVKTWKQPKYPLTDGLSRGRVTQRSAFDVQVDCYLLSFWGNKSLLSPWMKRSD